VGAGRADIRKERCLRLCRLEYEKPEPFRPVNAFERQ
jgi:hypothetical protein